MHQKYVAVPYYTKITHMQKNTIYSGVNLTLVSVWVQVYHAISSKFYVSNNPLSVKSQVCVVASWHSLLSVSHKHKKSTVCPPLSTSRKNGSNLTLLFVTFSHYQVSSILKRAIYFETNLTLVSVCGGVYRSLSFIYVAIECDKPS